MRIRLMITFFACTLLLVGWSVRAHAEPQQPSAPQATPRGERTFLPLLQRTDPASPPPSTPPGSPQSAEVLLPIEVLGVDGTTVAVRFTLDDPSGIDRLYLHAHRLAYRDASVNPARGAKGSVRLNGGAWVGLSNDSVTCYAHEAAYGCLNGAYHTVRLTVPLAGAKKGDNTLEFRFNGTDDFSIGYRILDFNLLRNGKPVLPASTFAEDDPRAWQPPLDTAQDIAAGDTLWHDASCHASAEKEGYDTTNDLTYFNFSNRSIHARHFTVQWANAWYTMIPVFREAGVSEATLKRAIDWGASVWPQGDWNALKQ